MSARLADQQPEDIYLSTVTQMELYYGAYRSAQVERKERIRAEHAKLDTKTKTAKKSPKQTGSERRKKAKPQDAEPVQLELGLD